MATVLVKNRKIPLNFTSGTILVLKPTPVAKPPASYNFALSLYDGKGDTLLQLWVCTNHILVRDHAYKSLGDGWGEPQTVDMTQVDLKGRSVLEVTVSIHHYLTVSEFGRYQILFN